MSDNGIHISLDDVTPEQWATADPDACLDCKRRFDSFEDEDDDEGLNVPLQLFRGEGDNCEMLSFCWRCAQLRMQKQSNQ